MVENTLSSQVEVVWFALRNVSDDEKTKVVLVTNVIVGKIKA